MEYTKGEWKVYKGQDGEIVYILAPFPEEHQTKENRNAEVVVVRMMGAWTGGKAEQQANAHLIAAAPIGDELANAVGAMNFEDYDDYLEVLEIAKRFKAKAEGK